VPGARDPEHDGSLVEGSDEGPPQVDERSSAPT